MVSQKCPSLVDASPMVQKQISFPLLDKSVSPFNSFTFLKNLLANARPNARGICPPVGAISLEIFFVVASGNHSPFASTIGVAKCAFICLPALKGSWVTSESAYNCAKNCCTVQRPLANIKVWSL